MRAGERFCNAKPKTLNLFQNLSSMAYNLQCYWLNLQKIENKKNIFKKILAKFNIICYTCQVFNNAELAERSNAAVLKTVIVRAIWGSNP